MYVHYRGDTEMHIIDKISSTMLETYGPNKTINVTVISVAAFVVAWAVSSLVIPNDSTNTNN